MLKWMRWIVWDIDYGLSIRKWAEVSVIHSKEARSNTRLTAIGLIHQTPDIHIKKYLVKHYTILWQQNIPVILLKNEQIHF